MAYVGSSSGIKTIVLLALIGGMLYYGWPIIEQILLMLPIPDPKGTIETV